MNQYRPTQLDVAIAAGVHRSTVSLTFSNHPSIPLKTRRLVLKCAKKLGYSPDPMLSALAVYRSWKRPKPFQGTLAWLTNDFPEKTWKTNQTYANCFQGALSRGKKHGYNLEVFDLKQSAPSPRKLASIFRAQNIQGILVCHQTRVGIRIDFPWEQFSAITFGYSLVWPQLHRVAATQYRAMVKTMQELKKLGYRRIGFCIPTSDNVRTDRNYLAGYMIENVDDSPPHNIPPFCDDQEPELFLEWYKKYRPDAIVVGSSYILGVLKHLNISVPGELGVACPCIPDEKKFFLDGVVESTFHEGETAMDYLVNLIRNGERGIPDIPHLIHIEGKWRGGCTTTSQKRERAPNCGKSKKLNSCE